MGLAGCHPETVKRWSQILTAAVLGTAFAIMVVYDLIHDSIPFFAAKPIRLLYVAALGLVGGFLAWASHRLSPSVRWWGGLFLRSVAALGLTVWLGYFTVRLTRFSAEIDLTSSWPWLLVMLSSFGLLAAWLWFSLWQSAKRRA